MCACRRVKSARVQCVVRVGCGVRARLGQSAHAFCESVLARCLYSRCVVSLPRSAREAAAEGRMSTSS
jgi:hypothetical protein